MKINIFLIHLGRPDRALILPFNVSCCHRQLKHECQWVMEMETGDGRLGRFWKSFECQPDLPDTTRRERNTEQCVGWVSTSCTTHTHTQCETQKQHTRSTQWITFLTIWREIWILAQYSQQKCYFYWLHVIVTKRLRAFVDGEGYSGHVTLLKSTTAVTQLGIEPATSPELA